MGVSAGQAVRAGVPCIQGIRGHADPPRPICGRKAPAKSGSSSPGSLRLKILNLPHAPSQALRPSRHRGAGKQSGFARAYVPPSAVSEVASQPGVAAPLDKEELVVDKEENKKSYDWAHAWYPVAIPADMDKKRPHALTLLGRQYVAWWDRNTDGGRWQVFQDFCPHRLAPLSEGRIDESGQLQCSYHGWTFRGNGGCSWIPQAPQDGPEVHANPKACAVRCPSVEHQHLLWMMPSSGPEAFQEAARTKPPIFPELDDPSFVFDMSLRDLPYGYEMLIENLMDPAHLPFAHHKIMGNRSQAAPLNLKVTEMSESGFQGMSDDNPATFYPPCTFVQRLKVSKKKDGQVQEGPPKCITLIFYCVPTTPGNSRSLFTFPRNFATSFDAFIPRWIMHQSQLTVLDSDLIFLHQQERQLELAGGLEQRTKSNYMPTKSDAFVAGFRVWLNKYAGGGPKWPPEVNTKLPPTQTKEILMDRYHSHVIHCKACSGVYKKINVLQQVLQVASFVMLAAVSMAAATQKLPAVASRATPLAVTSVVFFLVSKLLEILVKRFHFQDYIHAYVD